MLRHNFHRKTRSRDSSTDHQTALLERLLQELTLKLNTSMGDSSSEEGNTPRNRKPKLFSENQSSSEDKRSLCQLDDQHLNLYVDDYLPDDYQRYPCEYETYAVFSFPDSQAASGHRKEKSGPIAIGATALAPDDSQTDTPSSDGSDGEEACPKSKVKNSITTIEDSSNGYSGCSESEAISGADQHRINESECFVSVFSE